MPIFRLEEDTLIIAQETNVGLEQHLETWLENSPWALTQERLLWIGKQTRATVGESNIVLDLLGIDAEGNLVIVELKRDEAPRLVLAQLLEYAAWANELSEKRIHQIAKDYFQTREEFQEKIFDEAFRNMFDMLETDQLPPLNQKLRLFIVAEEVPARVVHVCRFLRTSYSMDINCIDVSAFQTECGEIIVSLERKVGNENHVVAQDQRSHSSQSSWQLEGKSTADVLWETVKEVTGGDLNVEFTQKELRELILNRYQDFSGHTLRRLIIEDCVNDPALNDNIITNSDGKYWWVSRGTYRLYDPEGDRVEDSEETN